MMRSWSPTLESKNDSRMGNPATKLNRMNMFHVEQFWQIRWHPTPNNPLDGAPGFRFLEPFQTVRHCPIIARSNPLIAMRPR
jgi:hypothetical protein